MLNLEDLGMTGLATALLGRYLFRGQPTEPAVCTGYVNKKGSQGDAMVHDCKALRSKECSDGRCTYHCKATCGCTLSIDAIIFESRKEAGKDKR